MDYTLSDLLKKLGTPEVTTTEPAKWHYVHAQQAAVGGFAEVRLDASGRYLIAESHHWKRDYTDEFGHTYDRRFESFYLQARRVGDSDFFRVIELSFDDEVYDATDHAMIELGLSIFHARAVEISTLMVEQAFNDDLVFANSSNDIEEDTEEMLDIMEGADHLKHRFAESLKTKTQDVWGVVVPFRPRGDAPLQRI